MQATKIVVKTVKMVIDKVQSTKVKKAATIRDNTKKTLPIKRKKIICKKRELYKIPKIGITTQRDEGCN